MDFLERNYKIIQERMIQQMENSLKLGKELIDTELDMGILNFFIRPIVKTFYDYWAQNDARSGTLKQIKITLDSGKELILKGNSDENFNKIVEQNFPKYFKADQTSLQCNKKHENYDRLKQVTKQTFINYLKELRVLLNIKEEVNDYGDLCRVAFKTKEIAKENLSKQIEYTGKAIRIIEEDPSILNIAVGKNLIIKALRKGFEQTKKDFEKAIEDTYDHK
ncbi:MAG: hypothetical protein ACFFBW_02435 [Promethearchaeota archaeon]